MQGALDQRGGDRGTIDAVPHDLSMTRARLALTLPLAGYGGFQRADIGPRDLLRPTSPRQLPHERLRHLHPARDS